MKKNISEIPFLLNRHPDVKKLDYIAEEMYSLSKLFKKMDFDDKKFEDLIEQLLELDPLSGNKQETHLKFCISFMNNFYLRKCSLIMEDQIKSLKKMLEISTEKSNEVSELRKDLLKQYDETLSSMKFSEHLFIERNELMDIAFEAKVYYPPFKKDFDIIHKDKIRSEEEKQFAISILDEVKSKKASFLMMIYRNKHDSKFLRVFPKLADIDFSKLTNKFSDDRRMFMGSYEEYFIKFCDAFKPSRKKPKQKKQFS